MLAETPTDPGESEASLESSEYIRTPRLICFRWFKQAVRLALSLALLSAGNNRAARMVMTAMTTSNSRSVNPFAALKFVLMAIGQRRRRRVTPSNTPAQAGRDKDVGLLT